MKRTLKKLWPIFFVMGLGCAQTSGVSPKQTLVPSKQTVETSKKTVATAKQTSAQKFQSMHPEERHIWLPPSEAELEARRQRQKRLDVVAADLERLFMGYADILGNEIILENLLRGKESEIQQLETLSQQQTQKEQGIEGLNQTQGDLEEIKGFIKEMDADLKTVQKEQEARKVEPETQPKVQSDDYRLAILLFRNGQYLRSIAIFKRILKREYDTRLKDNILFGLASNFYKLKKYNEALANLDDIIRNHPKDDKWLVSHAMSGLIYNLQGQSDKAIPILESALQHQPNPDLLKIINRLLKLAKEGVVDVSS
jgi:tetratricopeptide (TPR) repeat protein